MLKKFVAISFMFPLAAAAAPVVEGTYVSGTNKRVHISSFDYEGSKHYELFLANMETEGDSSMVIASKAKLIQDNQTLIFTVPENPYLEYQPNLGCRVEIAFSPNEIELKSLSNCTNVERAFNGSYVYSKQSSFVPKKFQGSWGNCQYPKERRDQAFLSENEGSPDGYYGFRVLKVVPISSNTLDIIGGFYYERHPSVSRVSYKYLSDKSVRIQADRHDSPTTYKKCRN